MFALRRVRDHIDRHAAAPLTLSDLAKLGGMSRFHLVRAFRAVYGETPIRYLSRRRIAMAQDLLRHANLTVTEVCMAVGFSSPGSFSTRFTELVGESPAAYQRRCCHKTYAALSAAGVQFVQEPADRPYGVEAVMRDNSGNWLVLVEPRPFRPEDLA